MQPRLSGSVFASSSSLVLMSPSRYPNQMVTQNPGDFAQASFHSAPVLSAADFRRSPSNSQTPSQVDIPMSSHLQSKNKARFSGDFDAPYYEKLSTEPSIPSLSSLTQHSPNPLQSPVPSISQLQQQQWQSPQTQTNQKKVVTDLLQEWLINSNNRMSYSEVIQSTRGIPSVSLSQNNSEVIIAPKRMSLNTEISSSTGIIKSPVKLNKEPINATKPEFNRNYLKTEQAYSIGFQKPTTNKPTSIFSVNASSQPEQPKPLKFPLIVLDNLSESQPNTPNLRSSATKWFSTPQAAASTTQTQQSQTIAQQQSQLSVRSPNNRRHHITKSFSDSKNKDRFLGFAIALKQQNESNVSQSSSSSSSLKLPKVAIGSNQNIPSQLISEEGILGNNTSMLTESQSSVNDSIKRITKKNKFSFHTSQFSQFKKDALNSQIEESDQQQQQHASLTSERMDSFSIAMPSLPAAVSNIPEENQMVGEQLEPNHVINKGELENIQNPLNFVADESTVVGMIDIQSNLAINAATPGIEKEETKDTNIKKRRIIRGNPNRILVKSDILSDFQFASDQVNLSQAEEISLKSKKLFVDSPVNKGVAEQSTVSSNSSLIPEEKSIYKRYSFQKDSSVNTNATSKGILKKKTYSVDLSSRNVQNQSGRTSQSKDFVVSRQILEAIEKSETLTFQSLSKISQHVKRNSEINGLLKSKQPKLIKEAVAAVKNERIQKNNKKAVNFRDTLQIIDFVRGTQSVDRLKKLSLK